MLHRYLTVALNSEVQELVNSKVSLLSVPRYAGDPQFCQMLPLDRDSSVTGRDYTTLCALKVKHQHACYWIAVNLDSQDVPAREVHILAAWDTKYVSTQIYTSIHMYPPISK